MSDKVTPTAENDAPYWRHVSGISLIECPECAALVTPVYGGRERHASWHEATRVIPPESTGPEATP